MLETAPTEHLLLRVEGAPTDSAEAPRIAVDSTVIARHLTSHFRGIPNSADGHSNRNLDDLIAFIEARSPFLHHHNRTKLKIKGGDETAVETSRLCDLVQLKSSLDSDLPSAEGASLQLAKSQPTCISVNSLTDAARRTVQPHALKAAHKPAAIQLPVLNTSYSNRPPRREDRQ